MDFGFSESETALREKVRGLFDSDLKATLIQLESESIDALREATLKLLKALGQVGYLTLGLDDEKKGLALVAAQECLAMISPSLYLSVEVSARIFGRLVSLYGSPDQKAEILSALKKGKRLGTVALSEDNMSVESNRLKTIGLSTGKGFRVTGSKSHIVNGPIADWIAVGGMIGEEVAFFLMKKNNRGLAFGKRIRTLGYCGTSISPLFLEDAPVPPNRVVGPFSDKKPLKDLRMWEDQVLTAASLGQIHRCYDTALKYAKGHKSGGKPIIAYQEVGFKLAEMVTLLQTAQLLAYRATWMAGAGDREAGVLALCAKVFASESAERVASQALQILGAHGYLRGNPAEEGYRNAKYLQIAGTSSEISRMKIGDAVLR
jgi:alkylation response protein AidB-like acyl-CoA dehydrogenase